MSKGYLLPEQIDGHELFCVSMKVPNVREYRMAVLGQLAELGKWWIWEKDGTERGSEAAQIFRDLFVTTFHWETSCDPCQTPFWYDADTVDDTECCDENDQDCEDGDGDQWLEQVADWIITAFLATTFSPGAAIAYKTTIPRVRLFFRTGSLGAIGEILIDGILWGAIDTYTGGAAEVIDNIIDLDAFRALHELGPENIIEIRHAGGGAAAAALPAGVASASSEASPYKLEVVRGDIRAPVLCDVFETQPTFEQINQAYFDCYGEYLQAGVDMQFRQTDCTLEYSTDGGQTWFTAFDASCAKTTVVWDGGLVVDGDTIINNTDITTIINIPPDTELISPDGLDKRCDLSSYLVDIPLPTQVQDLLTVKQNSANDGEALAGILGLGAAIAVIVPIAIPAYLIAGVAAGGAVAGLASTTMNIDISAVQAELTAQFWQDVKCSIYCHLPSDAILTPEVANDIADGLESDLLATYPNAIPLISGQFRAFSPEALGQYSIYGALYDGDNCDLCSCGTWFNTAIDTGDLWVSKYITLLGTTYIAPDGRIRDSAATLNNDEMEFIFDVTKTPAIITNIAPGGACYRDSADGDSGSRYATIDYWDVDTQQWVNIVTKTVSTVAGNAFATGGYACPPCTKFKVKLTGWGIRGSTGSQSGINYLGITGAGVNVLKIEKDELGI